MLFAMSRFSLAEWRTGRDGLTYYAAITTVDKFEVNSAPISVISILRYSLDSPV